MGNESSVPDRGKTSAVNEAGVHSSNVFHESKLESYSNDVGTMYESFQLAVKRYPAKACMGSKMGKFLDYTETQKRVNAVASGLKRFTKLERGGHIGIFSGSSLETGLAVQASSYFSWAPVPMFEGFSADVVSDIVKTLGIKVLLCSSLYTTFLLDCKMPSVKFIVQVEDLRPGQREKAKALGVTLFSFQDVELCGVDYPQPHEPPTAQDVCHVSVSPGTTGPPSLTRWTHGEYLTQVSAVAIGFWMLYATHEESYFSFNSLAFFWERVLQETMFITGSAIGFTSRGDVLKELQTLKPTFVALIPQFFGFLSARLSAALDEYSLATKTLFFQALEQKKAALAADGVSYTSAVYDPLFFNDVRALVGGKLKVILSIGDWVDPLPLQFLRCALCCPIVLAYGATETGIVTLTHKSDIQPGSLGPPLPGVEVRLEAIASLDLSGELGEPGQIMVRWNEGPWIATGDVGRWLPQGTLQYLDRIEDTVQVDATHYRYLGRLSNLYTRNQWAKQTYVYQETGTKKLVAVVVPDLYQLTTHAQGLIQNFDGLLETGTDPATLLAHGGIRKMVVESLANTCLELGLDEFHEKVERVCFQIDPFSIENHFLGVTLKPNRKNLSRDYF